MREEETKTKEALLILILAELFCARPKGDPLSLSCLLSRIHSFIMLMQSECTWPEVGGEGSTCRERSML